MSEYTQHPKTPHQFPYLFLYCIICICLCVCDGNFNLNTWFDADGGDLLDDFRWAVQINQTLVDPHLEAIPGFGAFTTGSLSGGDAQSLEGEPEGTLAQNNPLRIIVFVLTLHYFLVLFFLISSTIMICGHFKKFCPIYLLSFKSDSKKEI